MFERDSMIGAISSLTSLEELCLHRFVQLGTWPAEVAATLQPLHRLQALVGNGRSRLATEHPSSDMHMRPGYRPSAWQQSRHDPATHHLY